ncbi:nuclear transport factor 2 family protein [Bacillus paramycoides]|uniref:nuclear transport factor 2 family protein n=1 Tax=Bacillus paramycoides TaxID=2026194 RepID=UPI003D0111EF
MNREQAYEFLNKMYRDIMLDLNIDKIPDYFKHHYIQVTDGVEIDIHGFKDHMDTLKDLVEEISLSPFYDFLFDEEKQKATLRYKVDVKKKKGNSGVVEVIAIFEFEDFKIIRCNELTCALNNCDEFKDIGKINIKN